MAIQLMEAKPNQRYCRWSLLSSYSKLNCAHCADCYLLDQPLTDLKLKMRQFFSQELLLLTLSVNLLQNISSSTCVTITLIVEIALWLLVIFFLCMIAVVIAELDDLMEQFARFAVHSLKALITSSCQWDRAGKEHRDRQCFEFFILHHSNGRLNSGDDNEPDDVDNDDDDIDE